MFLKVASIFQALEQQIKLKDVTGKEIDGTIVFEAAFDFLVRKFFAIFANLQNFYNELDNPLINYVLIVPTHCNERIRQFVHRAAVKVILSSTYKIDHFLNEFMHRDC